MPLDVEKLKRLRTERGWTLEEAAAEAKLGGRSKWSDIENGRRANVTLDTLDRIAKALGVGPQDLLK